MQKFKIIGKPLLGEKYVHGRRKKEEERMMPSLVATTSASARTTFVRTHFALTKIITRSGQVTSITLMLMCYSVC